MKQNGQLGINRRISIAIAPVVCGALASGIAGCASGVQWRYDFANAYDYSKANQRLTLVYFRQWFLPLCSKVEESVFNTPELREATRDVTCIRYEMYAGDPLSAAWGVDQAPAYVIVDTEGQILARGQGEFSVAEISQAIAAARSTQLGDQRRSAGSP